MAKEAKEGKGLAKKQAGKQAARKRALIRLIVNAKAVSLDASNLTKWSTSSLGTVINGLLGSMRHTWPTQTDRRRGHRELSVAAASGLVGHTADASTNEPADIP